MKNLKKIIVTLVAMTMLMSTTVFAVTASDLVAAGVPANLAQDFADYVVANNIDSKSVESVMADLKAAKALVGDVKKVSDLSKDAKQALLKVQSSLQAIGVEVTSNGEKIVVIAGEKEVEYTKDEALALVVNADPEKLEAAIEEIAEDGKLEADPQGGNMENTATNNGNVLALGLGVVAVAGLVYVVAKKKVVA
ncbi:MAG: hypothetical protein SOZ71_02405 [Clostridium sp.]|nr:hypothetical protein [Clostridium sp.]